MPVENERIRPSTPADVPQLSALFREVFGTERTEDVWQWKLFGNPRGAASYLCEVDGRVVAHCAGLPVRFRDYSREYTALQSVDFMSSPSYAGGIGRGGVFIRTTEAFFRAYCGPGAIPLVYGFPGERHRLLGERLLGYRSIERVGELVLEPESGGLVPGELASGDLSLLEHLPIEFGAIRDRAYLEWRYLRHPVHRYGVVRVERALGFRPRVVAVVRETEDTVYLMEIGGSFSRGSVQALVDRLRRLGKRVVFWGSPHHAIGRILQSCGFQARSRDHSIECRFFTQHEIPRPGELYYTLGDYDVY